MPGGDGPPPAKGPPPKTKRTPPPPPPDSLANAQTTHLMNHLRHNAKDGNAQSDCGKERIIALATFKQLGERMRKESYDAFMTDNEKGEKDAKRLKGLTHSFAAVHESSKQGPTNSGQKWVTVAQLTQEFGVNLGSFPTVSAGCDWARNKWRRNAEKHKTAEPHPPQMDTEEVIESLYFYVFDDGLQTAAEERTGEQWASHKDYGKTSKIALEDMSRGSASAGQGGGDVKIENQELKVAALQRQQKDMKELMLSFDATAKRDDDAKWRANGDEIRPTHKALSDFLDAAELLLAEAARIPAGEPDDEMMRETRHAVSDQVTLAEKHLEGGKISAKRWKGAT
ncbi:unnamed protein product [Prorocentrum cordatum]|uniref:Myb/SANT-like domain-containing protein n=1 Tax=Prorocentrum cordatum TaxID=2364126 RepID=A0ABN9SPJ7_9DINO|nr:unnamed protein product [Polarella glacialis]